MHISRLLLVCACALLGITGMRAPDDWTPLWNVRDLDGWTTWMRQPSPATIRFTS